MGKDRLTTTAVARRAGVSVGTLYQYFPNKNSLLQAVLRRHFDAVVQAVETVCRDVQGRPLRELATALGDAFLRAKMHDPRLSVLLYGISENVDGQQLARDVSARLHGVICGALLVAPERLSRDPALITTVMQGAMAGVSRRLLESEAPELLEPMRDELVALLRAYLADCVLAG